MTDTNDKQTTPSGTNEAGANAPRGGSAVLTRDDLRGSCRGRGLVRRPFFRPEGTQLPHRGH